MKKHLPFLIGLVFVVFLSTNNLTESPPTWMDEGVFTQIARNVALHGEHAVQSGPGEFENGIFVTTSYPVTAPIALSFSLFGTGILQSRAVMALFIIVGYCAFYFIIKRRLSGWPLLVSLLLVAFFSPLYGHGKNVIGEVPGIVYLLVSFVFLIRILEGKKYAKEYILAGLFAGLAIVTKPIFILIVPALACGLFIFRKEIFEARKSVIVYGLSLVVPIVIWFTLQFAGESFVSVLTLYGNPNSLNIGEFVRANLKRFFTEAQPFYTLGLLIVWTVTAAIRIKKAGSLKTALSAPELVSWIVVFLMLVMYVRTAGYYRYFFGAEFLAIIFIVPSLLDIVPSRFAKPLVACFVLLVAFHAQQTFFGSWVSAYSESTKSAELAKNVGGMAGDMSVFFYQVPEAVNFIPAAHENYYQYIKINSTLEVGGKFLPVLEEGKVDIVVTNASFKDDAIFKKYALELSFDRYVVLVKQK